jgi:hypothetical protein
MSDADIGILVIGVVSSGIVFLIGLNRRAA